MFVCMLVCVCQFIHAHCVDCSQHKRNRSPMVKEGAWECINSINQDIHCTAQRQILHAHIHYMHTFTHKKLHIASSNILSHIRNKKKKAPVQQRQPGRYYGQGA